MFTLSVLSVSYTHLDVYKRQVEECGNMLILTAAVCKLDGSPDFAAPHMEVLKKWLSLIHI